MVSEIRVLKFHADDFRGSRVALHVTAVRRLRVREIHHASPVEINGTKSTLERGFHRCNCTLSVRSLLRREVFESLRVPLQNYKEMPEITLLLRQRDFPTACLHNAKVND
jgi:hypothetical protein